MFSRIWTKPSTKSCSEQIERLRTALQDCDAVVIGAGSGLSTAAGFTYTDEQFEQHFSDFAQKYGIRDMYSGGFYPFPTQGDYGLFQCSEPCCQETFDNEAAIRKMVTRQEDMKVPTELLPVCPHCGKPLTMNLRSDNKFVEDEGWHRAAERYENFLRTRAGGKILFLELGVGYNTPVFCSLRTGNKRTKTLRKQRISGHLQIITTNYQERRCA